MAPNVVGGENKKGAVASHDNEPVVPPLSPNLSHLKASSGTCEGTRSPVHKGIESEGAEEEREWPSWRLRGNDGLK